MVGYQYLNVHLLHYDILMRGIDEVMYENDYST